MSLKTRGASDDQFVTCGTTSPIIGAPRRSYAAFVVILHAADAAGLRRADEIVRFTTSVRQIMRFREYL